MNFSRMPRYPSGHVPGKDFVDTSDPFGLKLALVTRVDEVNMKVDLRVITGGGDRFEVDLTQAVSGPRSFWGGVPELNSIAIIGYRRIHKHLQEAVILGYLPVGNKSGIRFDPFSPYDPAEAVGEDPDLVKEVMGTPTRFKRLVLRPGDVGGMSSSGAELTLSKDISFTNRAGDLLELRDSDRTLVTQAIHRVSSESGVKTISGPVRRGAFFLPEDIFSDLASRQLKSQADGYFGTDELHAAGPGTPGGSAKFSNATGQVLELFNDYTQFPPVTYSNGRKVHYPPTSPAVSIEDPDSAGSAFTEHRVEMFHTTDLTQDVLEEIDGFAADRQTPYIEYALGTVVGNDMNSTAGQRQYGKILKPRIFSDFVSRSPGSFSLVEVDRQPTAPDIESVTSAGAFYFKIRPPRSSGSNAFVAAVSKQGKLFLNVPASGVEDYPSGTKKVSAEINMEGALKAFFGASNPDRISVMATMEGGVHLDIGRDALGNALTMTFRSGTKTIYEGNPNDDDVTHSVQVRGVKELSVTGAETKTIEGSKTTIVSGQYNMRADRFTVNAFNGYSGNYGEYNLLVSGKSQWHHALAVIETIVTGGKVSTILAGGLVTNVAAGAVSLTAGAGAMAFNCPSGAYSVTVGTGAISITTSAGAVALSTASGAMSLAAAGGAIAVTAGLALNLTAGTSVIVTAPTILLGGPTAVLGVCRGIPSLPPGSPTLDPITGTPLFGAATVLSN